MITEDYVSFETAKLLKEKRFTEYTLGYYLDDKDKLYFDRFSDDWNSNHVGYISAPTQQMAMRWLREVHNIVCNIDIESRNFYYYSIFIIRSSIGAQYQLTSQKPYFETYEEACEAAIKYCLENLI